MKWEAWESKGGFNVWIDTAQGKKFILKATIHVIMAEDMGVEPGDEITSKLISKRLNFQDPIGASKSVKYD